MKRVLSLLLIMLLALTSGGEYSLARNADKPAAWSRFDQKPVEYISLQPLIDSIDAGGVLKLEAGLYEGHVTITKPITIIGASNETEIYALEDEPAITIQSDDVTIAGVKLIDNSKTKTAPTLLASGSRLSLKELEIETAATAMSLKNVNESEIVANKMLWNAGDRVRLTARGNGIELINGNAISMTHNEVIGLYDGVYVENSTNIEITNNAVSQSRYAYHLMYSENVSVKDNTSTFNITGIMVMTTDHVVVSGNSLTKQNDNVNSQGILLFDAQDVLIEQNLVADNRVGFYIENAPDNKIQNNIIQQNFVGLQLIETTGLDIIGNNFIGNVMNVLNDELSDQYVKNNYWDSFQGIDRNGDNWSELTYSAAPFFQHLISQQPHFQLFFGTAGIQFLEELYQGDRIHWLTDEQPSMKQIPISDSEKYHKKFQYGMLIFWSVMLFIAMMTIYYARRRLG